MKRTNLLLTILLLVLKTTTIWGQDGQIGIIDFYGPVTNEASLKKCLRFNLNDTVHFLTEAAFPKVKKEVIDCLLSQPNIKQADMSVVCCDEKEGKWMVFVGVDTRTKALVEPAKTRDITLPAAIKDAYDSLMNLVLVAIEKGEATENDSNGHALMIYEPARQLQLNFINYADSNISLLKEVLQYSKYPAQREVAAMIIAYFHDKTQIINDLLDAVSDTEENVRNNAVRAIGIIANYSQSHPHLHLKIPADPFIRMMNSISWTDRNKSGLVLLSLTSSRDKKLLSQLKAQALKPLTDMAKWKSNSHSMPGFVMLARMAGWPDKEIADNMNSDRTTTVARMLSAIQHGK